MTAALDLGPLVLERPLWLLALLPLLVLAGMGRRRGRDDWSKVCDAHLLAAQRPGTGGGDLPRRVLVTVAALVVLSLAGPAVDEAGGPRFRPTDGLVVVIDVSPSMDLRDGAPGSRLDQARAAAAEAVQQAGDRQVALVVYAGDAYLLSPFTTDAAVTLAALESVAAGLVPEKGSRPAAGLLLARRLLDEAGIADGQVLLVSDGGGIDPATLREAGAPPIGGTVRRVATVLAGPTAGRAALRGLAETGGSACACGDGPAVAQVFARPWLRWDWSGLTLAPETGHRLTPWLWPLLVPALALCALLIGRRRT